ncbi:ADP-ribosylation factor-like protein 6-interacting protein 6 [Melanotaenia boesemani]|uniref:ADP-ribosylation factor-like protein 6-interacting protein 6 n=1 Tax=Melanotaenia boesemani TaxID=1250792 RepID=UPI001C0420CC|nr:ADP-ribosylation factor-like protein 6-interacting protein 6 [Melanotaenia boesemani]
MSGSARTAQKGSKPWLQVVSSVVVSAAAVTAVGCVCALLYPVLKELRAERVTAEDGAEQRMLGFWSVLVLSVLAGIICCVLSWTLTYLDSYQPGTTFPSPLILLSFRNESAHGFHMSYGIAALNGLMAMVTVIWSLT